MCERLVKTKVVQLQSQLKEAAVALIKQMDAVYTAKVQEISAAQQSIRDDIMSARHLIESARTFIDVDGSNSDGLLETVSSSVASISLDSRKDAKTARKKRMSRKKTTVGHTESKQAPLYLYQ